MSMPDECPVCLDAFPTSCVTKQSLGVRSFQCDHALCRTCDGKVRASGDNRCPTCRAPRKGMTEDQAQPRGDRNADPADFQSFEANMAQLEASTHGLEDLASFIRYTAARHTQLQSPNAASFNAGGYGAPPGLAHRPRSHTVFFMAVPPANFNPFEGLDSVPSDETGEPLDPFDARDPDQHPDQHPNTRDAGQAAVMHGVDAFPQELRSLIESLCDVPGTNPQIRQWHSVRSLASSSARRV